MSLKLKWAYSPFSDNSFLQHCLSVTISVWLLISIAASAAMAQTTVSLPASADAYVQDGSSANTNYGTAANLVVKKQSGLNNRQAYLKFDLSSVSGSNAGGTIASVSLRVYGKNAGSGYTGSDTAYSVADTTWTETGLTWNTKPAVGAALASAPITATGSYRLWDVTSYVQAQLAAGNSLAGFAVLMDAVPANGQADSFNSKEASSNPPQLVVTLGAPNAPTGLSATTNPGVTAVNLSWKSVASTSGYNVYRAATSGGPYTAIGTAKAASQPSYTDRKVAIGTTYYYVVTATAAAGESGYSNEVAVTPPAASVASLTVAPTTVVGGTNVTGTVTLNGPAGANGTPITLNSDNATATVPNSVIVPASASSVNFTITTRSVTQAVTVNLSASDGTVTKSAALQVTPAPPFTMKISFRPAASAVPSGYVADTGAAYSTNRGYGWVREDSLSSSIVPLDLTTNTRDRARAGMDPLLSGVMQMQYPFNDGAAVNIPGAWEYDLPNGTYQVTVSSGDKPSKSKGYDSLNTLNIEGVNAISQFQATASQEYKQATIPVTVSDGQLTIDAIGGTNTKINYVIITNQGVSQLSHPSVVQTVPANGATGVDRGQSIQADISLPNTGAGVDQNTLNSDTVQLYRTSDHSVVPGTVNTTGGDDAIIFTPKSPLAITTNYTFTITSNVRDQAGMSFVPYTMTFTTSDTIAVQPNPNVHFTQSVPYVGGGATNLTIGPDRRLYAAFIDGSIGRWTIAADGSLSGMETFSGLSGRAIIGLVFDPKNPNLLWVSDNDPVYPQPATDFTGRITQIYVGSSNGDGTFSASLQDYVVGLPRSVKDHMVNSLVFGPDGNLYTSVGANSSAGAPDAAWGNRPERLLSAAVLQIDPTLTLGLPINVQTEPYNGQPGSYDPYASGAPVRIYAIGLRNVYDMVWHSNGSLYAPTNGASAGGNTPATPTGYSPAAPAITGTPVEDDFLNRVVQGGYYGHPNSLRGQYIMDGGNPTAGPDPQEIIAQGKYSGYPVGIAPDSNWRPATWDFGAHRSPDGCLEYKSNAFGAALQHQILVVEYSSGQDLIAISLGANGAATGETQIFTGLNSPVGLTEDTTNGNLYVAELINGGESGQISLLRPQTPIISVSPSQLTFSGAQNGAASAAQTVTVTNTGLADLVVPAGGLTFDGAGASQYTLTSAPTLPATIASGKSITLGVAFASTAAGQEEARLLIASNAPSLPQAAVALHGLAAPVGGEPSLQYILNTFQLPINDGDPTPDTQDLPTSYPIGDEVLEPRFQKAGPGPVTLQPLAVYSGVGGQSGSTGPATGNVGAFGWYASGSPTAANPTRNQVFTIPGASAQTLNPPVNGSLSFDPGSINFGLYTTWDFFNGRNTYSEDFLNTFSATLPNHHMRSYVLKNTDGTVVPNAYVVAFEDSAHTSDCNDLVMIVRNVQPATGTVSLSNLDGVPFPDRLVFNRIGTPDQPFTGGVHDTSTLRITNSGPDPLTITGLPIDSTNWQLASPAPTLPATIAAGKSLDVPVQFIATSGRVSTGTLTVQSSDVTAPSKPVQLAGYWQIIPEGNPSQEATFPEMIQVFGYSTTILYSGQKLNEKGHVDAVGEEILSPYWKVADTSKKVSIRQLVSAHTYGNEQPVKWFTQGTPGTVHLIFTTDGEDAQSFLPRLSGLTGTAQGTFQPTAPFGFKIQDDFSDPTLNQLNKDLAAGGVAPVGHHVRFWPARDRAGNYIPYTWIMTMDYTGGNFDYNDNVYLVSNMTPANEDLTAWVNPLIGTGGATADNAGGTFPGAAAPFGMVQLSPDTDVPLGGGYNWAGTTIHGFSHTHLSGPGGPAYGDIPLMPTTGTVNSTDPAQYGSAFSHSTEKAIAGRYAVTLSTYGVRAELTASPHVGWHRYTFPATQAANVLFNVSGSLRGCAGSTVQIVDSQTVEGAASSWGFWMTATGQNPKPYTVYFSAKFDHPFKTFGTWNGTQITPGSVQSSGTNAGAYVTFDATSVPTVIAKVGISFVSLAGARANLAAETSDFNFDGAAAAAQTAWNPLLHKIEIAGGNPNTKSVFYTALYHALLHPNIVSDADGTYLGFDSQVHQTTGTAQYGNFSLWDTYRTEHELLDLVAPARAHDMMGSLMSIYREGGWLPRWSFGNAETNELTGDPVLPVLADAYFKGILNDPVSGSTGTGALAPEQVYQAMRHNATVLPPATSEFQGRYGLADYLSKGYVPYIPNAAYQGGATTAPYKSRIGASTTVEYALADSALAAMANSLGHTADYTQFAASAHNERSLFDASTGVLRPRMTDGTFLSPFDPTVPDTGFKEGSAIQYTWMAPQDILGLSALQGGTAATVASLDNFFAYSQLIADPSTTAQNVWGQGAYYNPNNEPDLMAPYLYAYMKQPYKTQAIVAAGQSLFTNSSQGIPGNDDLGTMSAAYVLSSLGLYPVVPGANFYALNSPQFVRSVLQLDAPYYTGSTLTITTTQTGTGGPYIQSMRVNGSSANQSWVSHDTIKKGATLDYTLGPNPAPSWAASSTPPNVSP